MAAQHADRRPGDFVSASDSDSAAVSARGGADSDRPKLAVTVPSTSHGLTPLDHDGALLAAVGWCRGRTARRDNPQAATQAE